MQHGIVIDEGLDGTSFRLAVDNAHSALSTQFYGPIDPINVPGVEVDPGFHWWDSSVSPPLLRVRNSTDTAWVELLKLDGTAGSGLAAQLALKLALAGGTMTGFIILHADPASAMQAATKQYVDATSRPAPIRFALQGVASVANKLAQTMIHQACTMTEIHAYSDDAPTGASLVVTLTRLRTAVADSSRSATITAGTNTVSSTLGTPLALLAGDRIRLDVGSVGSGTAGGNDLLVTAVLTP